MDNLYCQSAKDENEKANSTEFNKSGEHYNFDNSLQQDQSRVNGPNQKHPGTTLNLADLSFEELE